MTPFTKEMQIHIAKRRQEAVRIVVLVAHAVAMFNEQSIGQRQRRARQKDREQFVVFAFHRVAGAIHDNR